MSGSEEQTRERRGELIRDQASPDRDIALGLPDLLRDNVGPLLSVLLVSLVLRLLVWSWVTSVPVQLLYDENMYLARSLGAAEVVSALGNGQLPSESARDSWFGSAVFPPLHPLILAAGQLFPTDSTSGARLVNVLVSSLSTVLVFVFAMQLTSSRKAACAASLLHAVYPSFVMYSHYLWTEPTFIFILLLGAISTVAMFEASNRTDRFVYAALGGICVGGLSHIRAAGIPLLVALPTYAVWDWHRRSGWAGLRISAVYVVAMVATLAPWQLWVRTQTSSDGAAAKVNQMSLYMGNNPWVQLELGAANALETRGKVYASVQESGESPTKLALREIMAHPVTTSLRMLARVRMLISPDYWAVRHAIKVRYPPMLTFGFVVFSLLFFVSFWLLVGLIIRGLVSSSLIVSHVWLPIVISLALAVGPILTVARCRYHQPMLVIMLPFAAIGVLWFWKTVPRWRAICGGLAFCIFLTASVSSIPVFFRWSLRPSSYYFDVLPFLPSKANKAIFADLITIRTTGEKPIQERIDIRFHMGQGRLLSSTKQQLTIELLTVNPEWPVEFTVIDQMTNESFSIRPIGKSHWQRFKTTPIDGIYVAWLGAS